MTYEVNYGDGWNPVESDRVIRALKNNYTCDPAVLLHMLAEGETIATPFASYRVAAITL